MSSKNDAIGGYHDLSSNSPCRAASTSPYLLNSASTCVELLLGEIRPQAVWMPRYLCDSMFMAAERAGVQCKLYSVTKSLRPDPDLEIDRNDLLVYPNYFGVCSTAEEEVVQRFGNDRVILDRSQAFFESQHRALAEIYSPRKFFGVPDGGILISSVAIGMPESIDDLSVDYSLHLVMRLARGPEAGYEAYRSAENRIATMAPARMSHFTRSILGMVDLEWCETRRRDNFVHLHHQLVDDNLLQLDINRDCSPMCYPYLPRSTRINREKLARQRIYVPRYWPEVISRSDTSEFEVFLASDTLPLPCDQRYDASDMDFVIHRILEQR